VGGLTRKKGRRTIFKLVIFPGTNKGEKGQASSNIEVRENWKPGRKRKRHQKDRKGRRDAFTQQPQKKKDEGLKE